MELHITEAERLEKVYCNYYTQIKPVMRSNAVFDKYKVKTEDE